MSTTNTFIKDLFEELNIISLLSEHILGYVKLLCTVLCKLYYQ